MNEGKRHIKTVGVKAMTYPELRNFCGLNVPGYQFKKVLDFYKFPAYLYYKLRGKTHPRWLNLFRDFNLGGYDVLHFFNAVSTGKKPWICTFEYYLPRGAHKIGDVESENKYIEFALSRINSTSCIQLIAISQFAYNSQLKYLKEFGKFEQNIESKMRVIHPPQKLIITDISEKPVNKSLEFVMVGADFFRKGGLEVLHVFDKLLSAKKEVRLKIISKMQVGDYASNSNPNDLTEALAIIAKHKEITHYEFIENSEVLKIMLNADIVLLPSYEETYGYTVLEAQANGCPVITTNGTAFNEINNNEVGWVIEVELDEDGRSVPRSENAKILFREKVESGLNEIIENCLIHPEIVKVKGQNAINRIREMHNPEQVGNILAEIYNSAIS